MIELVAKTVLIPLPLLYLSTFIFVPNAMLPVT